MSPGKVLLLALFLGLIPSQNQAYAISCFLKIKSPNRWSSFGVFARFSTGRQRLRLTAFRKFTRDKLKVVGK